MALVEGFSIKSLFGKKDVNLIFNNKAQIYIGENGLGKTTVLNALNYLLNCDFPNLINILFSRIDIVIDHTSFSFSKEEIKLYLQAQESRTRRAGFYQTLNRSLDDSDVKKLQFLIRSGKPEMVRMQEVQQYLNSKGYSLIR